VKVRVDLDRCVGHGRCYELAGSVFAEDDRGHCLVKRSTIPPELEVAARRGAENCPEDAIVIEEE